MRCERAQQLQTARLDGELSAWRTRRLDRHLQACSPCAAEAAATGRLFAAMDALPRVSSVPADLERRTLQVISALATESSVRREPRGVRGWLEVVAPMLSAAAVLVVAVRLTTTESPESSRAAATQVRPARVAFAQAPRPARARGARTNRRHPAVPSEGPPPELAAAPDLFIELPILRNLEKLQHFETIRASRPPTTPGEEAAAPNG